MSNQAIGLFMVVTAAAVFGYYTTWTLILPFVDANNLVQQFFPPLEWAIIIPSALLLLGVMAVGVLLGFLLLGGKKKK